MRTHICRGLFAALLLLPTVIFADMPVKSMVIFGDSLSDTGNTTHLLKSLRRDENPAFLVRPLKVFVIRKMEEFADDYHVPQSVLDAGIDMVQNFFDDELAPMMATLVSSVRKVPVIPGAPYWHWRFSNGPVWNEYLALMLGIDPKDVVFSRNQAFAGGWAVTWDYHLTTWNLIRHPIDTIKGVIVGKLIPPSLGLSTQGFLMSEGSVDSEPVYFILGGGNDYLNAFAFDDTRDPAVMSDYIDNVVNGLEASVRRLVQSGARKVVVIGLPDIGVSPKFLNTPEGPLLSNVTRTHNDRLADRTELWRGEWPEVDFLMVDIQPFLQTAMNNPEKSGFLNVTEPCTDVKLPQVRALRHSPFARNYVLLHAEAMQTVGPHLYGKNYSVCDRPETYLFWDDIHPSTRAHQMMAVEICEAMKAHGYTIDCAVATDI